jgi:hypothetical protein
MTTEGQRITDEINSDPEEVARLRRSRSQAREGRVTASLAWVWVDRLRSDEAVMVLIDHQRAGIFGCACSWSELGKSHPRHVLEKLIEKIGGERA